MTNGTLFSSTSWTNYWVYYTGSTTSYATNLPVSLQATYNNTTTSIINASCCFCVDNWCIALYVNNITVTGFYQYFWSIGTSINITLLPGINIIDFHCNNVNGLNVTGGAGAGGLIYYVKTSDNTLLCQSDANTKCRLL
jgi:hypothetical protein